MKIGVHVSIAGSLAEAIGRAEDKGCETMQIFTRNPRSWACSEIDDEAAGEFRQRLSESAIDPVIIHMPYLPNLATGDADKHSRSAEHLQIELRRAEQIGAPYIVTHIGKALGQSRHEALDQVVAAVDQALESSETEKAGLLLENTAGQGSEVGNSIEELAYIIAASRHPERIGICIDTCHAWAAGYRLSDSGCYESMVAAVKKEIGIERLKLLHLNDAKSDLGSGVDRHAHIGRGRIGLEVFCTIVNDRRLSHAAGILETPVDEDGDDESNLAAIRALQRCWR